MSDVLTGADTSMPIGDIVVEDRFRRDLGDIDALATSIRDTGLLHPVVVTKSGRLVAGQRRLEAVRRLGWDAVPVRVAESIDSARDLLMAERDENTCRKEMAASELYALGKALEELERPKAAERRTANLPGQPKGSMENVGKTNDIVGESLGMSHSQWARLKHLGDRATAGDEDAAAALEQIDAGEVSISGAYRELREWEQGQEEPAERRPYLPATQRTEQIRELAARGYRASQIADEMGVGEQRIRDLARKADITLPDATIGKARRIDPNRVVRETVVALEGAAMGLSLLDGELDGIDPTQVDAWATSLSHSLRSLNRLAKQLKEMAHVQD